MTNTCSVGWAQILTLRTFHSPFYRHALGHFEYSEDPQSPEDGQAERAGAVDEVLPTDLEDGSKYYDAVEAIERGLEVDTRTQGVHPDDHFTYEQPEEDKLGVI